MRYGLLGCSLIAAAGLILLVMGATAVGITLVGFGVLVPALGLYFWALWRGTRKQPRPLPTALTLRNSYLGFWRSLVHGTESGHAQEAKRKRT